MVQPVPNPSLPLAPGSYNIGSVVDFDGELMRALTAYLFELVYRVNGSLPLDGTLPMTGDLDLGGFDILNVDDIEGGDGTTSAAAGFRGQIISSAVAAGSAVSLTTGVAANVTSIVLTPGDYDVSAVTRFTTAATTSVTALFTSSSTTSATENTTGDNSSNILRMNATVVGALDTAWHLPLPTRRFLVTANTTVYLVARANFTVSTLAAWGSIVARRVR